MHIPVKCPKCGYFVELSVQYNQDYAKKVTDINIYDLEVEISCKCERAFISYRPDTDTEPDGWNIRLLKRNITMDLDEYFKELA